MELFAILSQNSSDRQGVLALPRHLLSVKKCLILEKQPLLIMIDGVQDTRNLGAILRSAYCTNVDGVIIIKKGGAPINASTLKSIRWTCRTFQYYVCTFWRHSTSLLKSAGYNLYLAVPNHGTDALTTKYSLPLC